ncbi:unnamed protein product [Litomosoides sigmodontis]|uniref:Uncharacterized protein n=1 Tax=Litomosoides sigmodontis TaxID=42156 RepID=A0A3P6TAU4_LITSI|nr:unnamed protein product [Litomosoides sigmodontis]
MPAGDYDVPTVFISPALSLAFHIIFLMVFAIAAEQPTNRPTNQLVDCEECKEARSPLIESGRAPSLRNEFQECSTAHHI